jgi:indolepyruvate ferredoxin oxidoreductase alpha subunit
MVMDNNITAMTGGQPTPAQRFLADGAPGVPIDLERLIRGCGIDFVEVADPYDSTAMLEILENAKRHVFGELRGVAVVITRRPCVRASGFEVPPERYEVNETCDLCMTCLRDLECPAFRYVKADKRMEIDADLCAGCGFCVQVCPSQAIKVREA